jgi:dephospho-CoA kinase
LRIALTGGIASGKSAVADAFRRRGIAIIDADQVAREVVEPGRPALTQVLAEFGAGILAADGTLDRRRLRALVFADAGRRQRLEAILHPAIRAEMERQSAAVTGPYLIQAIPLLVEGEARGGPRQADRVLVVDVPVETQIERLMARDAETRESALKILQAQASREARLAAADDLIENTGSLAELDAAVERLHRKYLVLAGASSTSMTPAQ